jgi:hypothetical protein
LETTPHPKPYPLGWICDNAKLHVTRRCKLRFAINENYIDEVDLDVIPLDICGIVLGSPYLYERRAIFHRLENRYHLFKNGVEYIVRAHTKKMNLSLANAGQMKRLVNASKNLVLLMLNPKCWSRPCFLTRHNFHFDAGNHKMVFFCPSERSMISKSLSTQAAKIFLPSKQVLLFVRRFPPFCSISVSRRPETITHEFTRPESRNGEVVLNFHSRQ